MGYKQWASILMVLSAFFTLTGCRPAAQSPNYGPTKDGFSSPGQERTPPGEESPSAMEAPGMSGRPYQIPVKEYRKRICRLSLNDSIKSTRQGRGQKAGLA